MQMAMENLPMASKGKQTMEVLSGFLHSTRRTVEQLCQHHTLASMQASKQRSSVATSGFGMIPTLEKGISQDGLTHHVEMESAVGFFLNDMKKTVDTWCNRYQLLAEGKAPLELMPQPLHPTMQVMDQLGFGPGADNNYSNVADLDDRDNEVLLPYALNRQVMGRPFVKKVLAANRGVNRKPSNTRANRKRSRASAPQGLTGRNNPTHSLDPSQQNMVAVLEPMSNDKSAADIGSPVQTDELTIRPHHHKVEVVESPDWLPKGWITELKTRNGGGSAGCRDKYYYDPVSKRRCRSQKEVFCFLETGKLGRYKRKQQPANKVLGLDLEQQVTNSGELQVAEKEEVSGARSAPQAYNQDNTSGALPMFPGTVQRGWGGGTFLPYRPGQTADLLYDSLANLSRPGLVDQYRYMDPSSSKSSGDKSLNASRPWFLSNTDVSTGALVDRMEVDSVIDRAGGQGFVRGRRGAEGAPKRARKSTKRAVA